MSFKYFHWSHKILLETLYFCNDYNLKFSDNKTDNIIFTLENDKYIMTFLHITIYPSRYAPKYSVSVNFKINKKKNGV